MGLPGNSPAGAGRPEPPSCSRPAVWPHTAPGAPRSGQRSPAGHPRAIGCPSPTPSRRGASRQCRHWFGPQTRFSPTSRSIQRRAITRQPDAGRNHPERPENFPFPPGRSWSAGNSPGGLVINTPSSMTVRADHDRVCVLFGQRRTRSARGRRVPAPRGRRPGQADRATGARPDRACVHRLHRGQRPGRGRPFRAGRLPGHYPLPQPTGDLHRRPPLKQPGGDLGCQPRAGQLRRLGPGPLAGTLMRPPGPVSAAAAVGRPPPPTPSKPPCPAGPRSR
jgi:hypothetical protein